MALYSLPTIIENVVSAHLAANYEGNYTVTKAFTVAEYSLPLILVKAGKFSEIEPGTHVYQGTLAVSIITQADDDAEAVTTHDNTVAEVYDLLSDTEAFLEALNATGNRLHVHSFYNLSYDQESQERSYISILEYQLHAQTLSID